MGTLYSLDIFRKTRDKNSAIIKTAPIENKTSTIDRYGFDNSIYENIANRYGEVQPKGGVIYKTPVYGMKLDSYGRGNCHNSVFQYMPKSTTNWNRPIPFPSDIEKVYQAIEKNKGKVMVLGYKSDPFMWMDHKYKITQAILRCATANKVQLVINTMSDLCAHSEYIELIKAGNHSITMNMSLNNDNEHLERLLSPGAPSLKRRKEAIAKLKEYGIEVNIKTCTLPDNMPKHVLRNIGVDTVENLKKYIEKASSL